MKFTQYLIEAKKDSEIGPLHLEFNKLMRIIYVLNKSKTGSIGGFTTINIQKCIDEVKKYKKLSDFIKNSKKYYWYITKHNLHNDNIIIKELIDNIRVTNKPGKFKSKEECEKESLKYKTKTEFQLGSKTAWNYSRKNGWLYEFYPKKLN